MPFVAVAVYVIVTYYAVAAIVVIAAIAFWDTITEPLLEIIMGWFGIEDEDIVSTEVSSQRIIADDSMLADMLAQLALDHQADPDATVIEKMMRVSSVSRARFQEYFSYGKNKAVDGLPTSSFQARVVDDDAVKDVIDDSLGLDVTIITSDLQTPSKTEYVSYELQNTYDYTPWNNELIYLTHIYSVSSIDYNYTFDRYDVAIISYEDVTTTVTTTTTITITPYIEEYTTYNAATQYYTDDHVMYDNGTTVDAYICIADSLGNLPTDTNYWTLVDYDNKNTTVTERTEVVGTKSGVISDDTIELSNDDELIPTGTETDSEDAVAVPTTEYDVLYDSTILYVDAFVPEQFYVVTYYTTVPGEWLYWLYASSTGLYPELSTDNVYLTELEMLPVVTLRNATVNTNEDKESPRYQDGKVMLDFLGVDIEEITDKLSENPDIDSIEDAFVHFGLSPLETGVTVSKFLYYMFDYIFDDPNLKQSSDNGVTKHIATFEELPLNTAMVWTNQSRIAHAGILGPVGHYEHTVTGKTLTMRHQAVEEYYIEITLETMQSITYIDREGLWGAYSADLDNPNFAIPVSFNSVKIMTPLEQTEIMIKSLRFSVYSAEVTHLDWYETAAFAPFMQILAVVIIIATSIASGGTLSSVATSIAIKLVSAFAISFALEMVFAATDNPWIRAVAVIAATVAGLQASSFANSGGFLSASDLLDTVTEFSQTSIATWGSTVKQFSNIHTEYQLAKLAGESEAFANVYEDRSEEYDKVMESLGGGISTQKVLELATVSPATGYVEGPDLVYYKAKEMQFDWDLLKGSATYTNIYDYDKYFQIGVK